MNEKGGRKREPIPKNPAYSGILFLLAEQEDNIYGLVKRGIGKTSAALIPQMQLLYERGYLKKSKAKRNAYALNKKKIIPVFTARRKELENSIKKELAQIDKLLEKAKENK